MSEKKESIFDYHHALWDEIDEVKGVIKYSYRKIRNCYYLHGIMCFIEAQDNWTDEEKIAKLKEYQRSEDEDIGDYEVDHD